MKKFLLASTLAIAMSAPAFAIPNPIPTASELPEFTQFDTEIPVPSYADRVIYKFTPPSAGVLTAYEKSNDAYVFVGYTYYENNYTVLGGWYGNGPVEELPEGYNLGYAYPMTPDKVYYISLPLESYNRASSVMFTWEGVESQPTAVVSVFPEPTMNELYNYVAYPDIQVRANVPVSSFESVTLSYLDETIVMPKEGYAVFNGSDASQFLQVMVAGEGMINYIKQATEAGAKSITITVKGLCANGVAVTGNETGNNGVSVNNGTVTFSYAVDKAPYYVPEASTWPQTFYSYWKEGSSNGIAKLAFDMPVTSVYRAWVSMARVIPNSSGETLVDTYDLEPVVDGNLVYLDFTGVPRPSDTKEVTVIVQTVTGENGLPADMGDFGPTLFKYIPYSSEEAPADGPSVVDTLNSYKEGMKDVYDLNGRKLNPNEVGKGIYIIDGKKVIM